MSKKTKTAQMTEADALSYVQRLGLKRTSFSDADWGLYQSDPNRFSSIANYKHAYAGADSPEEKNRIHTATERLRQEAGYSGGADGSGYYMTPAAPGQFEYHEAPEFSYQAQEDPLYQAYRNQYLREGQRASQDALGSAAAASGGIPSSYASTAAGQAGNYYAAQLSDKLPELYQAAYDRYAGELRQYNTDRGFAYNQYTDNIDHNTAQRKQQWEEAAQKAAAGDYTGYSDLGVNIENNPLLLQQEQNALDRQMEENQWQWKQGQDNRKYTLDLARMALDSGDYNMVYDLLGITVNANDITAKEKLQAALFKAQNLGDYSWLNQLMSGQF